MAGERQLGWAALRAGWFYGNSNRADCFNDQWGLSCGLGVILSQLVFKFASEFEFTRRAKHGSNMQMHLFSLGLHITQ
jgi:hypothetical protein